MESTNATSCLCTDQVDGPQSPFLALRYHFGMLLGVTDFDTEQAYHRGKIRLHNQWLHRQGVAWGFDVLLPKNEDGSLMGEIRVRPGLAVDTLGRELHLEADACLNVAAWFEQHRNDPGFQFLEDAAQISFDAHVVIRFKTCLTRQVPALAEPCEHSATSTAYSRVFETVEILLQPGKAPPRAEPYHRLRLLFGLDDPGVDPQGAIRTADQDVLDAPKDLASFRRFAALDGIDLAPPEGADFPVTLADITGITLTKNGDAKKLTAGQVDVSVRPAHVATSTIQELLCGSLDLAGSPRVVAGTVTFNAATNKVTFAVTEPLNPASVTTAQFAATFLTTTGWQSATIKAANFVGATNTVEVELDGANPLPQVNQTVRFIAKGSGPAPLLGANDVAFNSGRDFVHMQKWS